MKNWIVNAVEDLIVSFLEVGWIIAVAVSIIVVCVLGIMYADHKRESVVMPAAYRAWVKQTDNPKNLSYDEWRVLVRATEHSDTSTVIPIYIHQ